MNRLLIIIAATLLCPGIIHAENTAPSDREAMEELYSQSLRALLAEPAPPGASRLLLPVYAGVITPSMRTRAATETILSALGYSIADSMKENSRTLTINITDARCTLMKQDGYYERRLSLILHVQYTDRSGAVLIARRDARTAQDRIPRALRKTTDSISQFSPEVKRMVLDGGPNTARIASLLALSAALGFFAFQK